ncbi:MAG: beta-propeller fold lactonase family protein, partial [Acidobacteria bacterium]|nr:beta-propeller fold lactonase family protein [Acidobacteriota bacterium]
MRLLCLSSPLRTIVFTSILFLFAPRPAQAQSPYLYASVPNSTTTSLIAGYSVAPDGTLTLVGSPLTLSTEGGLVTTDPSDQFLFVLNATTNTISVLSIDSNTGALTPVGPPVPAPTPPPSLGGGSAPSAPVSMGTFKG